MFLYIIWEAIGSRYLVIASVYIVCIKNLVIVMTIVYSIKRLIKIVEVSIKPESGRNFFTFNRHYLAEKLVG